MASPEFDRAVQALRAGNRLEAEKIAADALRQAQSSHPEGSLAVAQAEFDLASILVAVGDLARAITHTRRACAVREESEAARRERLTFLMNLGELLQRAGELEESETVHRSGLEGRASFYGEDHPGYAFGLEPLAEVLLAQARPREARPLLQRAIEIFRAANHPRLVGTILVEASCAKAVAPEEPSLQHLAGASTEMLSAAVDAALKKAAMAADAHSDPALWLAVLAELRRTVVHGGWTDAAALTNLVAAESNLARLAGLHTQQAQAFQWLIAHLDDHGDAEQARNAVLGLALAQSQAGNLEIAEEAYRDALRRSEAAGPLAQSSTLRNFGLFLAEIDRRAEAEPLLRQAVSEARKAWGGGGESLGRALVALGIFVQHGGEESEYVLVEARGLLQEAIGLLPADHPDTLPARSHLDAIQRGSGCGCGNMNEAISQALAEMVQAELPPGLLKHIAYKDDGNLNVELGREPSPEEFELLNRVIHQAMAQLKKRLRQEGY
ncbi:MAG: tetratricopeptide repeat protein [Myxococcota bacterium]